MNWAAISAVRSYRRLERPDRFPFFQGALQLPVGADPSKRVGYGAWAGNRVSIMEGLQAISRFTAEASPPKLLKYSGQNRRKTEKTLDFQMVV